MVREKLKEGERSPVVLEQAPGAVMKSRSLSQLAQQGDDDGRKGDDRKKKEKEQRQKKVDMYSSATVTMQPAGINES